MRHYYTTLAKARTISSMVSAPESAIYQVVGCGFLVGKTQLADEYKHAADTERGIHVVMVQEPRIG